MSASDDMQSFLRAALDGAVTPPGQVKTWTYVPPVDEDDNPVDPGPPYTLEVLRASATAAAAVEFSDGALELTIALRDHATPGLKRLALAIHGFGALVLSRRRRTGHRHRGSQDWALRYTPARNDLPLGGRTAAKRWPREARRA